MLRRRRTETVRGFLPPLSSSGLGAFSLQQAHQYACTYAQDRVQKSAPPALLRLAFAGRLIVHVLIVVALVLPVLVVGLVLLVVLRLGLLVSAQLVLQVALFWVYWLSAWLYSPFVALLRPAMAFW